MKSEAKKILPTHISEVWWCAVNPNNTCIWPYLDVTRANVAELLATNEGSDWEKQGWRIARLRVEEVRWDGRDWTPAVQKQKGGRRP